jgi:hypothetical protein
VILFCSLYTTPLLYVLISLIQILPILQFSSSRGENHEAISMEPIISLHLAILEQMHVELDSLRSHTRNIDGHSIKFKRTNKKIKIKILIYII